MLPEEVSNPSNSDPQDPKMVALSASPTSPPSEHATTHVTTPGNHSLEIEEARGPISDFSSDLSYFERGKAI